jgi:hypothetical protein
MSRTTFSLIGSGAILIMLLTGCDGAPTGAPRTSTTHSTRSSATPPTTEPPPTTTAMPPHNATPRPSIAAPNPGSHAPPRAVARECISVDLEVSLGASEGTAGKSHRALVFANTGRRICTIQGFPGVSFVAGDDGHQVGQAADRDGPKGPTVTLTPGATATAPLVFVNLGVFDPTACQPTPVRGLRVYPPHETRAKFVPFDTTACAGTTPTNTLRVNTVHPGSGLVFAE